MYNGPQWIENCPGCPVVGCTFLVRGSCMCVDARSLKRCMRFLVGICVVGGAVLWGGVFGWGVDPEVVGWVSGVVEFVTRSWR